MRTHTWTRPAKCATEQSGESRRGFVHPKKTYPETIHYKKMINGKLIPYTRVSLIESLVFTPPG